MRHISQFTPRPVPGKYRWAASHAAKNGPNLAREAFKTFGLEEIPGDFHSKEILDMAGFLGGVIEDFYTRDEIPWCGLAVSYWIKRAGFEPPKNYSQVRARDFASWGKPAKKPSFGDVLVFWRGSRDGRDGHVGLYVAEDTQAYYVLGGNQGDKVCISRIHKNRLITARRCPWRFLQPRGVKPFIVADDGTPISENEA